MLRQWLTPLLLIGFPLMVAGAFLQQWQPTAGAVVMVLGGLACAIYVLAQVGYDWWRKSVSVSTLRTRTQLDSNAFAAKYFAGKKQREQLAARIRDSLAAYLKLNLDGLLPDDDLNEVCDAQTDDPSLLLHFEDEFQLGQTFETAEEFEMVQSKTRTFRELLKYLETRLTDAM